MTRFLIYFALILFGPLIILISRFVLGYYYQWLFPGPHKINAVFRRKNRLHDWQITQRSFTALAGKVIYKFDLEGLNPDRQKYSLMLEVRAVLGKIKIIVPEEMDLVIENRSVFGFFNIFGRYKKGLWMSFTEKEVAKKGLRKIDLLISSRVLLGSIEIVSEKGARKKE